MTPLSSPLSRVPVQSPLRHRLATLLAWPGLVGLAAAMALAACAGEVSGGGDAGLADGGPADRSAPDGVSPPNDGSVPDQGHADVTPATDGTPRPDAGSGIWDPRSGPPPSKGIWIWYFDRTGMTAAQVADRCTELGISYVLIKSGQDERYWSTRYTEAVLREFTSRKIAVFAWPYVTPANIDGTIDATVQAAQVPGTSGVILDVEVEWEKLTQSERAPRATKLCDGIRAGVPGIFLGYTSWGWPRYHGGFPFEAFNQHCSDVYMPQVYWSDRGVSYQKGYDQAAEDLEDWPIPVWMIQSNDDIYNDGAPSTADLNAFFDLAGPYTSLWEWPAKTETDKLAQLGELNWSNLLPLRPQAPPRVLFPAPSPTVLPAYPLPAPRSHTNAAAVAASIQAVVGQLGDGRADALRESFLPALRPALSAEILASCRARLLSASLTPDWEMAEESSLAGHPVVRVSLFAKGMTGFHLVGGHWLADAVWCAPPRP